MELCYHNNFHCLSLYGDMGNRQEELDTDMCIHNQVCYNKLVEIELAVGPNMLR